MVVTAVGWYPTAEDAQGLVEMVCTTLSLRVSITETVSEFVLATNSAPARTCSAVGCNPTSMEPTAASGRAGSMTLTVPVVDVPRYGSAGTWVP